MTDETNERCLTMGVVDAGRIYLGLKPARAYEAARRGDIPTIRVGRLLRVPIAAMDRMLERAGKDIAG